MVLNRAPNPQMKLAEVMGRSDHRRREKGLVNQPRRKNHASLINAGVIKIETKLRHLDPLWASMDIRLFG